jgi:hypothetical protein
MSEIYYGPKVGRGCAEKMLKILDFWKIFAGTKVPQKTELERPDFN